MAQPERRVRITIGDGCFAAGTQIARARADDAEAAGETEADGAETAVEELAPDDAVLTLGAGEAAEAGARPVRRVVQRRVDLATQPDRALATPVRVRAGAIAAEVPRRDLLLPPEALLLFRDPTVLVPVGALVNGISIVHAPPAASLNWCALELDAHAVVLAENLPVATVRPDSEEVPGRRAAPCARLLLPGAELLSLRARLAAAAAPGLFAEPVAVAAEPGIIDDETQPLRLFGDAGEIAPEVPPAGGEYRFLLPDGTGAVRLISSPRASPAPRDTRRLGVAVLRLVLDGVALNMEGPELGRGFHPAEGNANNHWRWTDGRAWLVLPHSTAERRLEVKISDWHTQLRR